MAEYKIKVVTSSDVGGITKTIDAVNKLTAATKENAKSAKESASIFNDMLKSRNNATDQAGYVAGLTKEAKELKAVNDVTKEGVSIKGKWAAALKGLKNDIPGLAVALNALKNPFTAIIAVIATMLNWLQQVNEEIKRFQEIVGNGKPAEQFTNMANALAEADARAKELKKTIDAITKRPETVKEQTARMIAQAEQNLNVQEAADNQAKQRELAGVEDPAAKAAIEAKFAARAGKRAQARLDVAGNVAAQGQFRSQDIVRENMAQLPARNAQLADAQQRRDQLLAVAAAQTTSPDKMAELDADIKAMEKPGIMDMIRIQTTYGSPAEALAALEEKRRARENLVRGNANAETLRVRATSQFDSERKSYDDFVSQTAAAAEDVRGFGQQRNIAVGAAEGMRPFNGTMSPQFDREMQAAFERYMQAIARMFNDGQRRIDALSRNASSQSQQGN